MMLYKIQPSVINKIVGNVAANKMIEGYMYERPNSVRVLNQKAIRGKLNIVPDFNAIKILNRAKPMDIIEAGTVGGGGIIISKKLLSVFMSYVLPINLQIFDAYAEYKEERYDYHYFYIYKSNENQLIDWTNSEFIRTNILGLENIGERFNLSLEKKIKMGLNFEYLKPTKLIFKKKEIKSDIIRLDYSYKGYFLTETLKNEIEKSDCQGVDLIPIDQLGFEVEFI